MTTRDETAEKDAPSQEVRDAWEQAHAAFCRRASHGADVCSTHLRPGDRWMMARVIPPAKDQP